MNVMSEILNTHYFFLLTWNLGLNVDCFTGHRKTHFFFLQRWVLCSPFACLPPDCWFWNDRRRPPLSLPVAGLAYGRPKMGGCAVARRLAKCLHACRCT